MIRRPHRLWLCVAPTDMRRSYDGLATMVRRHIGRDPLICVGRDYVAAALHSL